MRYVGAPGPENRSRAVTSFIHLAVSHPDNTETLTRYDGIEFEWRIFFLQPGTLSVVCSSDDSERSVPARTGYLTWTPTVTWGSK